MKKLKILFFFFSSLFFFATSQATELFQTISPLNNLDSVYLAGPLFNEPERFEMERIAEALETSGFKVFLPHRDGLEFAEIFPYLVDKLNYSPEDVSRWMGFAIDALDVYQVIIVNGSLVMNLNGRVPDEGAIAELTMAWMLGKPTLIYKNDLRSLTSNIDNPLVTGRANFIQLSTYTEIPNRLKILISELAPEDLNFIQSLPTKVRQKLTEGQKIWKTLLHVRSKELSSHQAKHEVATLIAALYNPKSCINYLSQNPTP